MRKNLPLVLRSVLFSLCLFAGFASKANHIAGMQLYYEWVSGNIYRVYVVAIGDCALTTPSLATSTPRICLYRGSVSQRQKTLPAFGAGTEITPVCPSTLTTCTGGTIAGYRRYVTSDTFHLSATDPAWRFVFNGYMGPTTLAGRSSALVNITGGGSSVIRLVDTLNNTLGPNNSPLISSPFTPFFCQSNIDNFNPGAVDANGDALSYSLIAGLVASSGQNCATADAGGTVTYQAIGGYTATNPLGTSATTWTFDPATGQITFVPTAAGNYVVDYNIREIRGGQFVGNSMLEVNFIIQTCTTAPPDGDITSASAGTIVDSTHFEICENSGPFSVNISGSSPGAFNVEMAASGLPAGSSFSVAGDSTAAPVGTFSWTSTSVTPGTYTFYVSYRDDQCPVNGTNTQAFTVTIQSQPVLTGTAVVCAGSTTTFSSSVSGGTYTSSNTAVATVDGFTGMITGVSAGTATISYSSAAGCVGTRVVTVNLAPAAIAGAASVCVGSTTTLTNTTGGGTWSSSNTAVAAVVPTTGVVTGISAGTATVSYILTNGCFDTAVVTVNAVPAAITGTATVCVGSTTTFANATTGGTWSSSNPVVAAIGSSSGIIAGVTAGTATITYSLGTGCRATRVVTVNAVPAPINPITPTTICIGSTVTLTDATAGGTWSSSNAAVATVSAGGVVTGATAGTATISYILTTTGCFATKTVTVNTAPAAISPSSSSLCVGNSSTLSNSVTGGTWTSSNAGVASIGSSTGVVTAVTAGNVTITYAIGTCTTTATVTVNALPAAITPTTATTICVGATATLADATAGGTWSSSNAGVATVGATGIVTGVAAGTATISYTISATGCFITKTVTVSTSPAAITPASSSVCVGSTSTLTNTVTGGAWTSSNTAVATIGTSTGIVTGVSAGNVNITYAIGTCTVSATVTVNPLPAAITGTLTVCAGSTTTLANATPGGTWASSSTAIATVDAATGVVTGIAGGTATISYTLPTGCRSTAVVTVSALASAGTISGPTTLCEGAFTLYTSTVTGGTWTASNANATITSGGVATGVTAGTVTISYTVTNSCGTVSATRIVTVSAAPIAGTISGPTTLCEGSNITLASTATGGSWSTSSAAIATIGSSTGVLTGVTAGVVAVTYTVTNSCGSATATYAVTVNPLGSAGTISGPSSVCVAGLITLTSSATGGVWSSSNSNATVGSSSGIVTGVNPGIDTVTYTVIGACGLASTTKIVTINALPSAGTISGPSTVCVGSVITLSDAVTGGVWTAGNTNATVVGSGIVTGVNAGVVNITYTVTTSCGTATASKTLTVIALPTSGTLSGPDSVCIGATITLASTVSGGTWMAGNTNATVDTSGIVTGVTAGTVPITYTVTNPCGVSRAVKIITVLGPPSAGTISGPSGVCVGSGITLMSSAPGGTWTASNANATVVAPGIILGVTVGADTIFYIVTNMCGTDVASKVISVNPVPSVTPILGPTTHCVGTTITLINTTPGGNWTSSNMAVATVGLSTGIVTGITAGTTNITYTVTNSFGCPGTVTSADTVLAPPAPAAIAGSSNACLGATTTLTNATPGGTWSSSSPAIASVDAAGVVTGVAAGTATISYTVSNLCGIAVVTKSVTVNTLPVVAGITGTTTQCVGATATLANATMGGVWSSSDVTIATIDAAGVVTGVAPGTTVIVYLVTSAAGCSASAAVIDTVVALPTVAAITGATSVCVGATETLANATTAGVWSSSATAVATVDASGVVTGVTTGTTTITYTVTNASGCISFVTMTMTVNDIPAAAAITGPTSVCLGSVITLANTVAGGVWSSDDITIASIASTGEVTGVGAGTTTIHYTVTNGCGSVDNTTIVTVNALPTVDPITATAGTICSGTTATLSNTTAGGVWSSSSISVATIGSASGIATGIAAGTAMISYTVTGSTGCTNTATFILTVTPGIPSLGVLPTGTATLCDTSSITLSVNPPTAGLTYQWMINGLVIAGATNSSYMADSVGAYSVLVTSGTCSATLAGTTIVAAPSATVGFNPPNILFTGSFANYQWYLNGVAIAGATSSIITFTENGAYTVKVTDANGCSDSSDAYIVGPPVGVNGNAAISEIRIFPNPTTSVLRIEAAVKVNVKVQAMDGKVVMTQQDAKSIDVSNLADGLYMIMIYDENDMLLKASKFAKAQ
ncbi:MAG: Ig-like domain-containing protein [Bacteroidota bacterium]